MVGYVIFFVFAGILTLNVIFGDDEHPDITQV